MHFGVASGGAVQSALLQMKWVNVVLDAVMLENKENCRRTLLPKISLDDLKDR